MAGFSCRVAMEFVSFTTFMKWMVMVQLSVGGGREAVAVVFTLFLSGMRLLVDCGFHCEKSSIKLCRAQWWWSPDDGVNGGN